MSGQSLIVDTLTTTGQVLVIPGLTVNIMYAHVIPRLTVIFKPLSCRAVKIKYMCIQYSRFEVHTLCNSSAATYWLSQDLSFVTLEILFQVPYHI